MYLHTLTAMTNWSTHMLVIGSKNTVLKVALPVGTVNTRVISQTNVLALIQEALLLSNNQLGCAGTSSASAPLTGVLSTRPFSGVNWGTPLTTG